MSNLSMISYSSKHKFLFKKNFMVKLKFIDLKHDASTILILSFGSSFPSW